MSYERIKWSGFFIIAGLSSLYQACTFYYYPTPESSCATTLGFQPSIPFSILVSTGNLLSDYPDLSSQLPYPSSLSPSLQSTIDASIWFLLLASGSLTLLHGLLRETLLPPSLLLLIGFSRLSFAVAVAYVYAGGPVVGLGERGTLSRQVAVGEVGWALGFFIAASRAKGGREVGVVKGLQKAKRE